MEHQTFVFNTCLHYVSASEDAEDICQEVFVEAYRAIAAFRGDAKLSTWVYRIAVNKSLEWIRAGKRQKRAGIRIALSDLQEKGWDPGADKRSHPGVQMEDQERSQILFAAIDELADTQKHAFILTQIDGRSYQECADILETSVSAVESLLHRAKGNLRKKLADFYKNDNSPEGIRE